MQYHDNRSELRKSKTVSEIREAAIDELSAVEFFERQRWNGLPCCVHCGDVNVYQMMDRKDPTKRNRHFRWRCRGCKKQFTVKVGTVMEDSAIPLRDWAHAFWEMASAKNGISAMELKRKIQVSYRCALFMLHRLRFAMAQDETPPKMQGTIEADETYIGGKPRYKGQSKRGRGTTKQPVMALLERGGTVRTRIIPVVNADNVKSIIRDHVDRSARIMSDQESSYLGIGKEFAGGHHSVNHGRGEYVRGDVTTNAVEGFFSRVKRGLKGTYHAVSREHLHRYMSHFEFSHNTRQMNDGERISHLIRKADGKRLTYRDAVA